MVILTSSAIADANAGVNLAFADTKVLTVLYYRTQNLLLTQKNLPTQIRMAESSMKMNQRQ